MLQAVVSNVNSKLKQRRNSKVAFEIPQIIVEDVDLNDKKNETYDEFLYKLDEASDHIEHQKPCIEKTENIEPYDMHE